MARKNTLARVAPDAPPVYDPTAHTDPNLVVRMEVWCRCGAARRFQDPVSWIEPQARDWVARHPVTGPDGEPTGHGPATIAEAVAEQEARREAAFRVVGEQASYVPRDHGDLDTTCTADRPWPAFPATES